VATLPSVSVVIPTRARPELLRRAVASVLGQEYDGVVECVVVHDGEDPGPGETLQSGRRRVVAVRNQRRRGAAAARNHGLLHAKGDYVALCDDDDVWLPGKLARQVEQLEADASALGSCGAFVVRQDDRTTTRLPGLTRVRHADLLRSRVATVHPSTLVFRRERLLTEVGLFDEDVPGSYGEDYDWLLRATRVGDIATVGVPLAEVLWHSGSFFTGQWATIAQAIQYLLDKHDDLRADPKGSARLYGRLAFAQAALGDRNSARRHAKAALAADRKEMRAYLALAASVGVLSPTWAMKVANAAGKAL